MRQLSKPYIKILSLSIVFFMIVYIISIIFTLQDKETYASLSHVTVGTYIILAILSLSNYFLRFVRWYIFIHPMNENISKLRHCLIYISGFALTTTPGKAGETIRSVYLAGLDIKYAKSIGVFFSERLLDVLAVLCLSIILFSFSFPGYFIWILSSIILVFTILIFFRSQLLSNFIDKMIKHQSKSAIIDFQNTIRTLLDNKSLLKVMPLSVLAWGFQSYGLFIIVNALGFEGNIWLIMGIYNISILAGAISFIPGGIGATEATISVLLVNIGMDLPLAIIASIIVRGMTLWFAVGLGLISMIILNFLI